MEVPIKQFEDAQGNLNNVALVDAFPHPPSDTPDRMVVVADGFSTAIPPDAVTASSSGLDPHISVANAQLQAKRVADARRFRWIRSRRSSTNAPMNPALEFWAIPVSTC